MRERLQPVQFATSFGGTGLAYTVAGRGPPLLRMPHWMTHLEHDWVSPITRHWQMLMAERHTVVHFDMRGCGLSDREVADISFDACVRDAEAVAQAAGLDRYTLFGTSGGGALAIAVAARHPERTARLILHGTACRGRLRRDPGPADTECIRLFEQLIRVR